MLVSLHIENIAVVKRVDIDFPPGFTVLTGETGAGKSIIIDSINLLLGARPSRELIRSGEERASVSALFSQLSPHTSAALAELGIEPDEEGSVYISRTVNADGKAQTKINGRTIPVSLQREAGLMLINIHGQHENQALLDPKKHIIYLDRYASDEALLAGYAESYDKMTSIRRSLSELDRDEKEKARMTELIQYQITDIDSARLKPGEDEELEGRRRRIQNLEKIEKQAKTVYRSLYAGEKGLSACQSIDRALMALKQLSGIIDGAELYYEKLEGFRYEIEDIAAKINELSEGDIENSSAALDAIESRLDVISKLRRKYGSTVEDILAYRQKAAAELEAIETADERIAALAAALAEAEEEAKARAAALSARRAEAGEELAKKICGELAFLEMAKVRFSVDIRPAQLSRLGGDEIEFMISTNPGEPLKPLEKIASGGELSRVMLAIKSVLADRESTETLIFDEIDTGVSGKTSHKVGVKLKQIASTSQVLCVTHSAQIAALAHNHLYISKTEKDGRAETSVSTLGRAGRVEELARIMGGASITGILLETAAEMLGEGQAS